jgi:hypothetical protein
MRGSSQVLRRGSVSGMSVSNLNLKNFMKWSNYILYLDKS